VTISVIDYGIGISEEDKHNIFKPFFTTTDEKSKALNSTSHGIGLNFCHRICAGLKGDLSVTSQAGFGAEFVFCFPATIPEEVS
jgi:two-component system sensor histidine kinase/response regulator